MREQESNLLGPTRIGLVAATALFACIAHESMATWGRVILLISMAAVIPFIGRRVLHSRGTWAAIAFITVWISLCFLPGSWRTPPAWLATLLPSLPHPEALTKFVTPQAWISLQALLTLAAVLAWGTCVTGVHWRTEQRKLGLGILTAGLAVVGLTFLFLKTSGTPWPGAEHDAQFGPFANRNQTAAMFAIGTVCATGLLLSNGRRHWPQAALWSVCLGVLVLAVTQAGSRAGVLAMATGVTAISGWWSIRCGQWVPLAIGTSALLLACSYLILQNGSLTDRIAQSLTGATREGRVAIWQDSASLIAEAPVLGTGLGNFEHAFAHVRDASISEYHVRHPESDWLWLAAEVGIPGVIGMVVLLGLLLTRVSWKPHDRVRSRHHLLQITAAVAVLLFIALSTIDVPAHRLGSVLPAVLLLAIAIDFQHHKEKEQQASPSQSKKSAPWISLIRRILSQSPQLYQLRWPALLSAVPAIAAICWVALPSSHRANAQLDAASKWTPEQSSPEQVGSEPLISSAISIAPLDWRGYFLRASQGLAAGPYPRIAQRDFQTARVLAPHSPSLPRQEARAWVACGLKYHAIPAWRQQLNCDPSRIAEHFGSMLETAKHDPALTRQLVFLAVDFPDLQLQALQRTTKGDTFDALLAETIVAGSDLNQWNSDQLASLFAIWHQRGNHDRLKTALTETPRWTSIGWKTLFKLHVDGENYIDATKLAAKHLEQAITDARGKSNDDTSKSSLNALRQAFAQSKGDLATGLKLARIEANSGCIPEALEVLGHLARIHTASSVVPPVLLLKAWCHQQLGQHKEACVSYSELLKNANKPKQPNDWVATVPDDARR